MKRYLKALAFVPPKFVVQAFEIVKSQACEEFKPMIAYFEPNYIGNRKSTARNSREKPRFPISHWNVYQLTLEDRRRADASIEAWHGVFPKGIAAHPETRKLLEHIRHEQTATERQMQRILEGEENEICKKQRELNAKIKRGVLDFKETEILEYLDILAIILQKDKQILPMTTYYIDVIDQVAQGNI
jgi:hypothetical protein